MLEYGKVNRLEVVKETDIAYSLSDGIERVFLHFNQSLGKLNIGDKVDAFLYFDQKKRLCATLETPQITRDKYAFVPVVGLNAAGVFVNIGISKDILLSSDFLPNTERLWPRVGEMIPCIIKVKTNQLVAKPVEPMDIKESIPVELDKIYTGTVVSIFHHGINVVTKDFQMVHIDRNLLRKVYHIGEEVGFKILEIRDKLHLGTTIEQKEKARVDDAEVILEYMRNMGGRLPLGNASTPDEIFKLFNLSKSAFKRAMGHLYRLKLIEIFDHESILVEEEAN